MQRGIGVLLVVGLLLGSSAPAWAGDEDLERIKTDLARLGALIEKLAKRLEALESRVKEIGGTAGAAPFTGPPGPPIGIGHGRGGAAEAPPSGVLKETEDRFTGDHKVEAPGPTLVAKHKDDPMRELRVTLSWISLRKGGAAGVHGLDFEVTGPLRQWPPGTMFYMLSDGRRTALKLASDIQKSGGTMVETLGIQFDSTAARSFVRAKKVEVRIGTWELEIPQGFRKTAGEAIRLLDGSKSGK